MQISITSRITPKLRCGSARWIIAAARSVPPVVALPISTRASPTPRMAPPVIVASRLSSVRAKEGKRSRNSESSSIDTSERAAKDVPMRFQLSRKSGILMTADISPTGMPQR